jgi:hypothetical protein
MMSPVASRAAEIGRSATLGVGLLAVALAVGENPRVPVGFPAVASMGSNKVILAGAAVVALLAILEKPDRGRRDYMT